MSNLFKAFTPYLNNTGKPFRSVDFVAFDEHEVEDPSPTSWGSVGFARFAGDELFIDVQGAGFMAMVQFNERILPGSVQKEKIAERLAAMEEQDGRKAGKKQYAQVRDDVIMEMLPMALIKRKLIPVLFIGERLFIFTTSAKKCDDTLLLLIRAMPADTISASPLMNCVTNNIVGTLTTMAKEGGSETDFADGHDRYDTFETTDVAVIKGENKETIRIKDKDIDARDVQELLKQKYELSALGLSFIEAGDTEHSATIVLTDKLIVSRFALSEVKEARSTNDKDEQDTFINTAWMTAKMVDSVTDLITHVMGGLKGIEQPETKADFDIDDL